MVFIGKCMYSIDMNSGCALPEIRQIATTYCSPDWQWNYAGKQGTPGNCFLWLVMGGHGELIEGGRRHEVGIGDCLLMPATEDKRGRHDERNPLIVSWAELRVVDQAAREPVVGPLHIKLDRPMFLSDLFSRALGACRKEGLRSGSGSRWMGCLLEECFRLADKPDMGMISHHSAAIQAMCAEIRRDPTSYQSVAQMARKLHVSPDHFIRLFRQVRGMTPGEFILGARIEMAASLLLFTRRTMAQIADELGYCDAFHFSKQFKTRVGVSPLVYRRSGGTGVKLPL